MTFSSTPNYTDMNAKKYELLKRIETPWATIEKGEIFTRSHSHVVYLHFDSQVAIPNDYVENNPEWFREVKPAEIEVYIDLQPPDKTIFIAHKLLNHTSAHLVADALNGKLFTEGQLWEFAGIYHHQIKDSVPGHAMDLYTEWLKSITR